MVVQGGCHNPDLGFVDGCECTPGGGYVCWHLCTEDNCNEKIDLHEDMLKECKVIEDGDLENPTDDTDDEDEENSAAVLAAGTVLLSLLC